MALGGGIWTTMNKTLPGAYINYISVQRAGINISDRGVCALPIELNWGAEGVIEVKAKHISDDCMSLFGYPIDDVRMKPIREVFKNASTCYFYRLNAGEKASCAFSTAKYSGVRGNDIKHVITVDIDEETKYNVDTYMGTTLVDTQTVSNASELVDNEYVVFIKDATLEATAGINLTGGSNGAVSGTSHQEALEALESYSFNALGCMSDVDSVKAVYASYTKRMRDEIGSKFQLIVYNYVSDCIGVINVPCTVTDSNIAYALVPWVVGAEAGCAVNATLENKKYDGEYTINTNMSQLALRNAIAAGQFVFHKVGTEVHVLSDINSYTTLTKEMNEDFQLNQVVRVLDQIATDIGATFNSKYIGKIQNNVDGRISLWSDIVDLFKKLQTIGAIEEFETDDIVVEAGAGKRDVVVNVVIKPICSMSKLYMTVQVN